MYFHNKPINYGMKRNHYPKGFEEYLLSVVEKLKDDLPFIEGVDLLANNKSSNYSSIYIELTCKWLDSPITVSFRTHEPTINHSQLLHLRLDKIANVKSLRMELIRRVGRCYLNAIR